MVDASSPSQTYGQPDSEPEYTGNLLVLLEESAPAAMAALQAVAGITVATTADSAAGVVSTADAEQADGILYDQLGVAVVRADPGQVQALSQAVSIQEVPIAAVERERVVYAVGAHDAFTGTGEGPSPEYLQGYRHGAMSVLDDLVADQDSGEAAVLGWGPQVDESAVTWGLQAINLPQSRCSGRGVRMAVLDTGIAPNHPDFAGRSLSTETFVPNEAVDDRNGHGTHCAGTACGPQHPQRLPRYGVACDAELHVGKVLSNAGRGPDGGILAGINWALTQGCRVISMSLGGRVAAGQPFSDVFEQAAQRVVQAGTVLIAAAGNDSRRGIGVIFPVSHPANCPSILAVAAVDQRLRVADFSNRGINPNGGQVDIAAPGRSVLSSAPPPTLYRRLDGTSMATPHVAGVAALTLEAQPGISASELIARLLQTARRLPEASTDVGAGLVQAP